jgi:hypothetical protein
VVASGVDGVKHLGALHHITGEGIKPVFKKEFYVILKNNILLSSLSELDK